MGAALNDPHVVKLIGLLQDFFRERAHSGTCQVLINLKDPMIKQNFRLRDRDEAFALLHSLELITPQVKLTPGTYEVSPLILVGEQQGKKSPRVRTKKSTSKGDAQTKIIGALSGHHQFDSGEGLNFEPIGGNKLARLAEVSKSTVSLFFQKQFAAEHSASGEGRRKYREACRRNTLSLEIKRIRDELIPTVLWNSLPVDHGDKDGETDTDD